MRRYICLALSVVACSPAFAEWEPVTNVDRQPLVAATKRLMEAFDYVGSPLSKETQTELVKAMEIEDAVPCVKAIQAAIDPLCIAQVNINPESRVSVREGEGSRQLIQQGWRTVLVKVHNEAGVTAPLTVGSPQAEDVYQRGRGARQRPLTDDKLVSQAEATQRFLDIEVFGKQPLKPNLSGLEVEYRIMHLYSRDAGKREATLTFNVGQGTQDLGFRSELPILFDCQPSVEVVLGVLDHDGTPTTAAFVFRDERGRVYPNPAKRLAPDFFFHDQIYRADNETVHLPPGKYTATVSRGPEYLVESFDFEVPADRVSHRQAFQLTRWIHPKEDGWYSGDHHVHAAGCKHYDSPTEGVGPSDMLRHILGEDLNVGCVLSWGPCWYTQKQYFEGKASALSLPNYLMRYDVEVSGFPSSHAGHLCLLRLTEDDYPGTTYLEEWPSWTLPVLQWGQKQGGVVGYSHSGWGLGLPDYGPGGQRLKAISYPRRQPTGGRAADKLPDYAMPPFDGIGANEYIVTTAHGACDFISTVDTPAIWELNIWYHTLNCGMTSRISGETDFPCIYGEKVGLGRVYVKLDEQDEFNYDNWVRGLKDGRSYVGDGLSHIMDMEIEAGDQAVKLGRPGPSDKVSVLDLEAPSKVKVSFSAAALLAAEQTDATRSIKAARLDQKPYWHIERCRVGDTREVPVEIIVNGEVAARSEIEADGSTHEITKEINLEKSSWVTVRILPSCHTNPIFVHVDNKPIRVSKRSAQWCQEAVDVCWNSKKDRIREEEREAAKLAYEQAKEIYRQVESEAAE